MPEAIKGLLQSRKAVLVLAVIVAMTVLVGLGHMDVQLFVDTVKPVVMTWLGAHATEEVGKALAVGKAVADRKAS